jgi:hypothetical protein
VTQEPTSVHPRTFLQECTTELLEGNNYTTLTHSTTLVSASWSSLIPKGKTFLARGGSCVADVPVDRFSIPDCLYCLRRKGNIAAGRVLCCTGLFYGVKMKSALL